ncbi:MAG: hypothetical protein J7K23_08140 [Thermoproteales archaeon]|nr:hypothetical protein [Thermoproteales archaeon]
MVLKISPKTWKILEAIPFSQNAYEIAEKSGVSYNSVLWFLNNYRKNYIISSDFNFWKIGLVPLVVLTSMENITIKIPPYTIGLCEVSGLKKMILYRALIPEKFIKKYIKDLDTDVYAVIKGKDIARWLPNSKLTAYIKESETIEPITSKIYEVYNELISQKTNIDREKEKIDIIDLYIIRDKMIFSFAKLSQTLKRIHMYFSNNVTKQLLSYHYNKHVKRLWKYNYIIPLHDTLEYPLRLYYLKGKDAEVLGKLVVNLPYVFTSLIDKDKVMVLAQPTPRMEYLLYDIFTMFDVKKPLGDILISMNKYSKFFSDPSKLFIENEWRYPDIIREIKIIR